MDSASHVTEWNRWAERSYGHTVYHLDRCRKAYLDSRLKEYGLASAHIPLLEYLWEGHDGDTQTHIAEHIGVDPATVTRVAQRLERLGVIQRRVSPRDPRALVVELTERGRDLSEPVRMVTERWSDAITEGLPSTRRTEILGALHEMLARALAESERARAGSGGNDSLVS